MTHNEWTERIAGAIAHLVPNDSHWRVGDKVCGRKTGPGARLDVPGRFVGIIPAGTSPAALINALVAVCAHNARPATALTVTTRARVVVMADDTGKLMVFSPSSVKPYTRSVRTFEGMAHDFMVRACPRTKTRCQRGAWSR